MNLNPATVLLFFSLCLLREYVSGQINESGGSNAINAEPNDSIEIASPDAEQTSKVKVDPGWFDAGNGYQYRKSKSVQNWEESRRVCHDAGGDLAFAGIRNLNVRSKIIKTILEKGDVWIGLTDIQSEGTFWWLDSVLGTARNIGWRRGEPNNYGGNEHCVHIPPHWWDFPHNTVNDAICSYTKYALCEKRLGTH